jgi:hypothetical protein
MQSRFLRPQTLLVQTVIPLHRSQAECFAKEEDPGPRIESRVVAGYRRGAKPGVRSQFSPDLIERSQLSISNVANLGIRTFLAEIATAVSRVTDGDWICARTRVDRCAFRNGNGCYETPLPTGIVRFSSEADMNPSARPQSGQSEIDSLGIFGIAQYDHD